MINTHTLWHVYVENKPGEPQDKSPAFYAASDNDSDEIEMNEFIAFWRKLGYRVTVETFTFSKREVFESTRKV